MKLELHITDEDIIGAVRWHTTGKANMTQLEKIVYLADFISEDRNIRMSTKSESFRNSR